MSASISSLVGGRASAVESRHDLPDAGLFPEEELRIQNAVARRRREFATTRACARMALGRLGVRPVAIPADLSGAPVWPGGIVGSITHCDGYRAAVVAEREEILGIGIDAEPPGSLRPAVLAAVMTAGESAWLSGVGRPDQLGTLLFSAKEAVYKLWHPLTREPLGFRQVEIMVDLARRTFIATLPPNRRLAPLQGRWAMDRDLILTAAILPRTDQFPSTNIGETG